MPQRSIAVYCTAAPPGGATDGKGHPTDGKVQPPPMEKFSAARPYAGGWCSRRVPPPYRWKRSPPPGVAHRWKRSPYRWKRSPQPCRSQRPPQSFTHFAGHQPCASTFHLVVEVGALPIRRHFLRKGHNLLNTACASGLTGCISLCHVNTKTTFLSKRMSWRWGEVSSCR